MASPAQPPRRAGAYPLTPDDSRTQPGVKLLLELQSRKASIPVTRGPAEGVKRSERPRGGVGPSAPVLGGDEMRDFEIQTIEVAGPFETAFRYVADPRTLPDWTHAFRSVSNGRAILTTPRG